MCEYYCIVDWILYPDFGIAPPFALHKFSALKNKSAGSRQQKLRVPKRMLYNAQWEAWVAVAET